MPVIYVQDKSIFESDADVLVNSTNVKGVMGAGIAREFKRRFPEMFRDYKKACRRGDTRILARFEVDLKDSKNPKLVIYNIYDWKPHVWVERKNSKDFIILNFPTKIYWDLPSDYKIIEAGLKWIRDNLSFLSEKLGRKIKKIAIPQIGTGYGGLEWNTVKNLIEEYLGDLDIFVEVYLNYKNSKQQKQKILASSKIDIKNDQNKNIKSKSKLSDFGIS